MSDNKLGPFRFWGVDLPENTGGKKDVLGHCPFCEHSERKLSAESETGRFRCWHCNRSGNGISFVEQLHTKYLETTTSADYKQLAKERRGIPWQSFRDHRFAKCGDSPTAPWSIPYYSPSGSFFCARRYGYTREGERIVVQTTGLPVGIFRLDRLLGRGPVYLLEGEWDPLAWERLRTASGNRGNSLGVPGAGTFKKEWINLLKNRDVVILFDNDSSGQNGVLRTSELLHGTASSILYLPWPSDTPDGYDIRDLVADQLDDAGDAPKSVWSQVHEMLRVPPNIAQKTTIRGASLSPEDSRPKGPKRTSFPQLLKDFTSRYFLDTNMKAGLALMCATVLSIQIPGDPIWLFIVGPPGSGKTLLLESFRDSRWCIFRSSLTPHSLISGFQTEDGDPSLIPQLQGLVLILKDYTEVMSMSRDDQEQIYGILRGAYDGHASKTFGNGVHREYPNCHFGMLAGVTDEIYVHNRANLGERFIKFKLVHGKNHDKETHIRAALRGMAEQVRNEEFIRAVTSSFVDRWDGDTNFPGIDKRYEDRIVALAQVVAKLRSTVTRNYQGEMIHRPDDEVGSRLAKQFSKISTCLSLVYGKKKPDDDCYQIITKVAADTCRGWSLDIARLLMKKKVPTRKDLIELEGDIPSTTCQRRLEDLLAVDAVRREKVDTGEIGRSPYAWSLNPEIRRLWTAAKFPV